MSSRSLSGSYDLGHATVQGKPVLTSDSNTHRRLDDTTHFENAVVDNTISVGGGLHVSGDTYFGGHATIQGLAAMGSASLADVAVTGNLEVDGNTLLHGNFTLEEGASSSTLTQSLLAKMVSNAMPYLKKENMTLTFSEAGTQLFSVLGSVWNDYYDTTVSNATLSTGIWAISINWPYNFTEEIPSTPLNLGALYNGFWGGAIPVFADIYSNDTDAVPEHPLPIAHSSHATDLEFTFFWKHFPEVTTQNGGPLGPRLYWKVTHPNATAWQSFTKSGFEIQMKKLM